VNDTSPNALHLSDDEVRGSVKSDRCAACSGVKALNAAFCRTDVAALTIWQRHQLAIGFAHPDFLSVFRAALRHLQLNAERRQRIPERDGWRHATAEDLAAAGYRFIRHATCGVPKCGTRVMWYRTPANRVVCVNFTDCQPHRSACPDPDYFQRRAQTSARRGRRR
jgi:hypothetical protein